MRTDRRTDIQDETNSGFSQFSERVYIKSLFNVLKLQLLVAYSGFYCHTSSNERFTQFSTRISGSLSRHSGNYLYHPL